MIGPQRTARVTRFGVGPALCLVLLGACAGAAPAPSPPPAAPAPAARPADDLRALDALLERPDPARLARARQELDERLRERPDDPALLEREARWLLASRRAAEALEVIGRALELDPQRPEALATQGRILAATGDLRGARGSMEQALALAPDDPRRHQDLARICILSGDLRCALDESRRDPTSKGRILSAEALIRMGRIDSALAELESIPPAQRDGQVWYRIADVKLIQGDELAARRALAEADARDPNQAEILKELFELDAASGVLARAQALERIQRASAARPHDAALALLEGRALAASGRFDEAIASFERAIELDPGLIDAYTGVASLLGARGEKYALEFLEQARKQRPTSGAPDFVLGLLREGREDWGGAIEAYERALAREPGFAVAKNNLAWSLTQSGKDLERALALAKEARAALPLAPEIADTLGYAYLLSGDAEAALPLFLECLGRMPPADPNTIVVEVHLAEAYAALGERIEARRVLQRVTSRVPPLPPGTPEPSWLARARTLRAELEAP